MSDKITIPERHQEFCKAIARVCREHGVRKAGLTYTPDYGDEWGGDMAMSWEQGRHGADADKIFIHSTLRVWTRIDKKPDDAA